MNSVTIHLNSEFTYRIHYKDVNQVLHKVADIQLLDENRVNVICFSGAIEKYPTLDHNKIYGFESLWSRIPSNIRKIENSKRSAFNLFVEIFGGRLATDRFQFEKLI